MHSVARQKRNATDELKQKLIDTCDRIPQGTINETIDQWQTRLHACVKAKGRHFDCDLATQPALFRVTSDQPKPVLFRATHIIERTQRNFLTFVQCQVV